MKKRLIFTKDSPDTFKVGDTDSTLSMQLVDTTDDVNAPVDPSSFQSVKMVIRSKDYYLRDLTPAITKDSVTVNSADLADLPAGSYYFEAWATTKDGKAEVYPDYGFLGFEITQNGYYQAGGELAGVAVDKLRDEFHKYVDDQLAAQKPVDLSDYVKSEQLAEYAKKQDVPVVAYDSAKNTLSINGQSWELQPQIDLSSYAKKSDVPVVGLDVKDRTLSINGIKIDIPAKVDLAQYVTSEQFNEAVQAFPVVTYNSSTNDLEVNGQKVPLVSDQDVDNKLTGYAKKTDLPVLTLDTTKRTLNVNGVSINIPASVDLSGYAKTSEVPKVTYDATNKKLTVDGVDVTLTGGQSADLSQYVKESDLFYGTGTAKVPAFRTESYSTPYFEMNDEGYLNNALRDVMNNQILFYKKIIYNNNYKRYSAPLSEVKTRAKIVLDYADHKLPPDKYFSFGGNYRQYHDYYSTYKFTYVDLKQSDISRYKKLVDPIYQKAIKNINDAQSISDIVKITRDAIDNMNSNLLEFNVISMDNDFSVYASLWYFSDVNSTTNLSDVISSDWTLWPVPDNYTPDTTSITNNKEAK